MDLDSEKEKRKERLRSLSRRDLQAKAKALGVRAIGTNIEIVDRILNELDKHAETAAWLDTQEQNAVSARRHVGTARQHQEFVCGSETSPPTGSSYRQEFIGELKQPVDEANRAAPDNPAMNNSWWPATSTPIATTPPQFQAASPGACPPDPDAASPAPVVKLEPACATPKAAHNLSAELTGTQSHRADQTMRLLLTKAKAQLEAAKPKTSFREEAGAKLSLEEARQNALTSALKAKLSNLQLESERKAIARPTFQGLFPTANKLAVEDDGIIDIPLGPTVLSYRLREKGATSEQPSHVMAAVPEVDPMGCGALTGALTFLEDVTRRLPFVSSDSSVLDAPAGPLGAEQAHQGSSTVPVGNATAMPASAPTFGARTNSRLAAGDQPRGGCDESIKCGVSSSLCVKQEQEQEMCAVGAVAPTPPPAAARAASSCGFSSTFPPPPPSVLGVTAPSGAAPQAEATGFQKAPAYNLKDRTPLRQQPLHGLSFGPPPSMLAATPGGRPQAGLLGGGGGVPRTPGTGLRTPARRVPVCTDDAQARATDEWVKAELMSAAGGRGQRVQDDVDMQGLVALDAAQERLKAMFSTHGSNGAVLLYGLPGMGKSLLVRAFTRSVGAAYLHLPPDLAARALPSGVGPDAVVRAAFRVATQASGPVVVHVEDADQLVGVEATRGSEARRRTRTELLVGVDELLLQQPQQNGSAGGSPATPSALAPAAAAGPKGGRCRVLVVTTTSCPMDMDNSLAFTLGRTDRVLVPLPDAEAREMFLVGRLASVGAALGVHQVEHIVSQTGGMTCADMAALCDCAVALAKARQGRGKGSGRSAPVGQEDIEEALRQPRRVQGQQGKGQRGWDEAAAELQQWHDRMAAGALRPAGLALLAK